MARNDFLFVGVLIACCIVGGSSTFADDNPIRQVIDGLHDLETSILQIIGNSRPALSFARFAHRYGKRYEGADEMQKRFEIFSKNLRIIRSHNKKELPYTLAVNEFADLTWDEFRKHKLGAAQNCSATTRGNHKLTYVVLPEMGAEDELKHVVGIVRPVSVAFEVVTAFRFYKEGVYTSTSCGSMLRN